ncbi:MAG: hypothetical protein ACYDA6_09520 [Solirubrobacteraceae bacterium]
MLVPPVRSATTYFLAAMGAWLSEAVEHGQPWKITAAAPFLAGFRQLLVF